MTTSSSASSAGSATIYQFPARGRFAVPSGESSSDATVRYAKVAAGSSWYHDEAIREAEGARKN